LWFHSYFLVVPLKTGLDFVHQRKWRSTSD
jgi:hypothetical protein